MSRAALRYAKAILGLAGEKNMAGKVNDDMKSIHETVTASRDLKLLVESPVLKTEIKKAALKEVFASVNEMTQGLIDLLINKRRIDLLDEVAQKYTLLYDELIGNRTAVVTTAVPLSEDLEKKVLAKVKELTGNDVSLVNKIDESIIGGFILRVGDMQYNASIANKLQNLKREFSTNLNIA